MHIRRNRRRDLPLEDLRICCSVDVVGYSKLLVNEQIELLQELKQIVRETRNAFALRKQGANSSECRPAMGWRWFSSTVRKNRPQCALEISKALQDHPSIRLRMGVHSGPVNRVIDVNEKTNIAGSGINVAQRVLDCGDAGHILLSAHVAEDLAKYRHWQTLPSRSRRVRGEIRAAPASCLTSTRMVSAIRKSPRNSGEGKMEDTASAIASVQLLLRVGSRLRSSIALLLCRQLRWLSVL